MDTTAFITSMDAGKAFRVFPAAVMLQCDCGIIKTIKNLGGFTRLADTCDTSGNQSECNHVVVMYDQCSNRRCLNDKRWYILELLTSIECQSQPLSVKFVSDECMLVLTGEPEYMMEVQVGQEDYTLVQ